MAVGQMLKAIEYTTDYVRTRQAFGRTLWGLVQLELWHQRFIDPPAH